MITRLYGDVAEKGVGWYATPDAIRWAGPFEEKGALEAHLMMLTLVGAIELDDLDDGPAPDLNQYFDQHTEPSPGGGLPEIQKLTLKEGIEFS